MKIWGYHSPSIGRFKMIRKPIPRIHKDFPLLVVFNIFGAVLIFYCYITGYLQTIIAADMTGFMIWTILGVAAASITIGMYRSWFFMNQAMKLNRGQPLAFPIKRSCTKPEIILGLRFSSLLSYPQICPIILTSLGLLGTIAGILIMMKSMGSGAIGDAAAARGAMTTVLGGYGVALYTTLCGLVFSIWMLIINGVLNTQADRLLANILYKMDANNEI